MEKVFSDSKLKTPFMDCSRVIEVLPASDIAIVTDEVERSEGVESSNETSTFYQDISRIDVSHVNNPDIEGDLGANVALNAGQLAKLLVKETLLAATYGKVAKWASFTSAQKKKFTIVWKALPGMIYYLF